MAEIDRRALRGQCCFQFLHYSRKSQIWAQKLESTYCAAPTCGLDDMLCLEHYRAVSGIARRDAMQRVDKREQLRRYRSTYYIKRRAKKKIEEERI